MAALFRAVLSVTNVLTTEPPWISTFSASFSVLTPSLSGPSAQLRRGQTLTSLLLQGFFVFSIIVVNSHPPFGLCDRLLGKETGSADLSWVSGWLTENVIHC